jgi:Polyketide cyclase / dehydrase and lipid transport
LLAWPIGCMMLRRLSESSLWRTRGNRWDESVIRIEREHRFATPVEVGFAFITDPANWPAYWPGFVRIEPDSRWKVPGDEARIVIRLLGREVGLQMKLARFEENRLVEYDSTQSGAPDAHHERHFSSDAGGFSYRIVVEFEPRSGLRGLYDRILLRRGVESAVGQTVANLDARLSS